MDTEEHIEIQNAIRQGHPETDEGPYYHDSWWESYKGSVKGKFGGIVIGALIGAIVGVIASVLLLFTGGAAAALPLIAGFSAAGMLYGAHEFSDIGKIVGSDAATAEKLENRIKSFIKKEFSDLKTNLTGKKPSAVAPSAEISKETKEYRTKHSDDHQLPTPRKWVFWNVAAIGALVGLTAGAVLAAGGVTEPLIHAFGHGGETLSAISTYAVSMVPLGLFGASFGVNRDMFRHIFDKTDLLFRGIIKDSRGVVIQPQLEPEIKKSAPITTIVYDSSVEQPQSDTYHRDIVMSRAKQALLGMDHTKARPN